MKRIVIVVLLTVFYKYGVAQKYDYPIDEKTGKITYDKAVKASGAKEQLFKRALQFVAVRDFGRIIEVKTHYNQQRNFQLIKDPITYSDIDEGKVFGNGYMNFQYRGHDYFFIVFTYRIYVKDNEYRYVFTDFTVKELWDAGDKQSGNYGSRSGKFGGDARTINFPLEDFIARRAYYKSDPVFRDEIQKLKHQLKMAIDRKSVV